MRRIAEVNINTPEEYLRVWNKRKGKVDWFDFKRWRVLLKYFKGGKLIDLGCLDSLVPFMAKDKFPEAAVFGLDFVPEVIDAYNESDSKICWVKGDVYDTHFPDSCFDYVVAGELIEHLENPMKFFAEAFRILKRKGILALSTPLEETEAGEVDKERHLWSFNENDIFQMLGQHGRVKTKIIGSQYFPYRYAFPNLVAWCKKR